MSAGIIMLSLLAAFLGAAAGALMMVWRLKEQHGRLLDTVDKRLSEFARVSKADRLMTSQIDRLSSVVGRWHQYNVTRKNDSCAWIHVEYEIKATPAGALDFSVEYRDNQGGTAEYLYEGVLRDDRVVLIGRPATGEQPCFVEIWPHLANNALKNHFGICLNQSWDQQETVIPCIMSRTRIEPFNDEALDLLWIAHLQSPTGLDVFPRLRNRLGGP